MRGNRPGILRVGNVHQVSPAHSLVTGWELTSCASGCTCHRHPSTGHLALWQDAGGRLGLVSWLPAGCSCCQPWTALELAGIVQDLAGIDALDVPPRLAG